MATDEQFRFSTWERNFIAHMKALRRQQGMTQTDLARKVKSFGHPFHQQTVQRIENGERPVRLDEANVITIVLGTSLGAMTDSAVTGDAELVRWYDAVCRRAAGEVENVKEGLGDFTNDYELLVSVVQELVDAEDMDDLSASARWGLTAVFRAETTYRALWDSAVVCAGLAEEVLDEWDTPFRDQVREWQKRHGREVSAAAFDLDMPMPRLESAETKETDRG